MNRVSAAPGVTGSASTSPARPPWWLHALLFGLSVLTIAAVIIVLFRNVRL